MIKITCGIPIFNQKLKYFQECLQSVINQTLSDDLYEIIILDDGSDVPIQIELQKENSLSIKVIRHEKNLGIGKSRQSIVDNASKESEFICFLSSDDIWDKDFLKIMLETSKKQRGKILYSESFAIDRESNNIKKTSHQFYDYEDFCIACWNSAYKDSMFVNFSCVFIPKEVFEKCKFNESLRYCEDMDFLLRSMKHFHYHLINQPIVYYRVVDNLTSRIWNKIPKQNEKIRKEAMEYWENG